MRAIKPRKRHTPGTMNDTEQRYAAILDRMVEQKEIIEYAFEPCKLKLANNTFYTPDFLVTFADHMEFQEVKGHWEDDARVKIKVAARLFWQFDFMAVTFHKGAPTKGRADRWQTERI